MLRGPCQTLPTTPLDSRLRGNDEWGALLALAGDIEIALSRTFLAKHSPPLSIRPPSGAHATP